MVLYTKHWTRPQESWVQFLLHASCVILNKLPRASSRLLLYVLSLGFSTPIMAP